MRSRTLIHTVSLNQNYLNRVSLSPAPVSVSNEKLNGVKGWSAKLLKCFSDEGQGQNIEAEANTRWCTCFHSLGEDAQFTANRLSVDFAAQVVEPHLRRAKVEEQKNNISR